MTAEGKDSTSNRCLSIGVTGGIASGKSTVCQLFSDLGISVVDTDIIAREVVRPGQHGLQAIVQEFGDQVINKQGELDRQAMRSIVFSDAACRKKLEAILHPLIVKRMWEQVNDADSPYCLIAVPLLLESGLDKQMDRVLVIDVSPEIQLQRLKQRDGAKHAEEVISAQTSREQRLAIADDVIDNNGAEAQLEAQVAVLDGRYRELAATRRTD